MYVNDHVDIFDMVDIDLFTVVALNMMVVKLGCIDESEPLFYNYLKLITSLDEGLYALACEEDVRCMDTLVWSFKLIEVYIEHGVTALDSYLRAPRFRAKIEDIIDVPHSIAAKRTKKVLLLTWHESSETTKEPVCDSVTPSSLPQHDSSTPYKDYVCDSITPSTQVPIVEEVNTQEPIVVEISTRVPTVEKVRYQEFTMEDVVLEDYVSFREDVAQCNDEDNEIVEPGVDVHLFGISIDLPFNNVGVTNLVQDDILEGEDVDVINTDGFDSDPGNDDEIINYRKRRLSELSEEIKEAKDRVYLHSIESKMNLKLYKNDSVKIRARCDRKVHVFRMSRDTGPTGPNYGMKSRPSGSSGPPTRSKKRKNTGTNDDSQASSSVLDAHDNENLT
nr:hypothetical protein [Tanacetum cinerariifolium]